MKAVIQINNAGVLQQVLVMEGITLATERFGGPGKLTFDVYQDKDLAISEGNEVSFTVDGREVFYGFIFSRKMDKENKVSITAYDQIRYLLNKDTKTYGSTTASGLLRLIAAEYNLPTGTIEETSYVMPPRVEDNKTLLDMIYYALDQEVLHKKKSYVLYDDYKKLMLKSIDNMMLDLVLNSGVCQDYDYSVSIDDNTYNKINLIYDNKETGRRDRYVLQDSENISRWGVLQYHEKLQDGENGDEKAAALLSFYNVKTRKLKISKAVGDIRVRAGSMIIVSMYFGDIHIQDCYMLVEKCTHTFDSEEHWMDLNLIGGAINGS